MKIITNRLSLLALLLAATISPFSQADEAKVLVASCAACHGANGASTTDIWPNLAGQKRTYLAQEIKAFRDGQRQEPTMQAFVAGLSDAQIDTIARHYSELSPPGNKGQQPVNQAGENVRAMCMACHGVAGLTVNETWPNLAGQKSEYLFKQLKAFADGSRMSPLMNVISNELTEQQMRDVAEYYSQLPY